MLLEQRRDKQISATVTREARGAEAANRQLAQGSKASQDKKIEEKGREKDEGHNRTYNHITNIHIQKGSGSYLVASMRLSGGCGIYFVDGSARAAMPVVVPKGKASVRPKIHHDQLLA